MKWTPSWLLWMMLSMSQTWAAGEVAANPDEANADADADAKETVAELIEGDQHYPGLFSFYRDTETGDTTLLLKPEQKKTSQLKGHRLEQVGTKIETIESGHRDRFF